MTEQRIKLLVSEAVALDRELSEKSEHLKELKRAIVFEAQGHTDEHNPTEGGGSSWTAQGADGCVVRVSFPAPGLRAAVEGEGQAIEKIRSCAGRFFPQLFNQMPRYRPVENFRDEAERQLGPQAARKLIRLCEMESAPRVSFETKEKAEAA